MQVVRINKDNTVLLCKPQNKNIHRVLVSKNSFEKLKHQFAKISSVQYS